jgi:hypothetical protein
MSLIDSGKNYIAQHFGLSNCFVPGGVSYTDPAGKAASGSTMDIVATLKLDDGGSAKGPAGEVYADIVSSNGGNAITNADVVWIGSNDGSPAGEAQYCYTVTTGSINFNSVPSGAEIFLDGTDKSIITPATLTGISAGSHTYILKLSGYNDATGTVTVTAGLTASVSVTLVLTPGSISFASTPSGADIYLDNILQSAKTPATITSVSAGSHIYIIRLTGYNDATGTVMVTAGLTAAVSVTLTTTGSISFASTPSGADIYLDGTLQTPKTPTTITNVSVGNHSYILRLSGYNDAAGTVTVTAGLTTTVSVTLVPTTGSISFASTPSGADIYLDSVLQAVKTPSTITSVSTGSHTYIIRLTGYNDATGTVTVTAGLTAAVSVTLTPVVTTGSISFSSVPSGADIYLDAVNQGIITPATLTKVSTGSHSYTLKLTGYEDASGTVTVTAGLTATVSVTLIHVCVPNWQCEQPFDGYENDGCGNRRLNASCSPPVGRIYFETIPAGAEVNIDGVDRGVLTPVTLTNVTVGSHSYTLKLTGYDDAAGTVTVTAGLTSTVSITLILTTGSISFASMPSGADIYLDGALQTAKTPATITGILPGSHSYILKLSGYIDAPGTVTVVAEGTAMVSATLVPVCVPDWQCEQPLNGYEKDGCGNRRASSLCDPSVSGVISFETTPAGARIFIDGVDTGRKTPFIITIMAGEHTLTLKLSGYSDALGTITINTGETWRVLAILTPAAVAPTTSAAQPSSAGMLVGAVVVGLGLLGIVMMKKK